MRTTWTAARTAAWGRVWTAAELHRVLAALVMAAAVVVVFTTFRDYGITHDEEVQDNYGHMLLSFYASGFKDLTAFGYQDLYLYGGLFDLVAVLVEKVVPFGNYEARHLLGATIGLVGLAGAWRLGRHLGGERAGLLALTLTVLTPALYGHAFNNPKDLPFAVAMLWALYFMVRAAEDFPRPRLATMLWLGTAFGAALSIRVGALLVLPYYGFAMTLYAVTRAIRDRRPAVVGRAVLTMALRSLPALVPALALVAVFWPWVVRSPGNLLEAIQHFSRMPIDFDTNMAGIDLTADKLPATYLPAYLLVTMPEMVLVGAAAALVVALRWLPRWGRATPELMAARALPALAVLFPIGYFVILRPAAYDGLRHFLFLVPPLVVVAALGLDWVWARASRLSLAAGLGFAAVLVIAMLTQLMMMAGLHPQEYAYYNSLVGGVRGAYLRWEGDYWSNAMRESSAQLAVTLEGERAAGAPLPVYTVSTCGNDLSAIYFLPANFVFVERWEDAQFLITNDECWRDQPGRMIVRTEHMGVTYSAVFDRRELRGE